MEIQGYIRNIETSKYSDDASPEIVKHCKNTRWKSIFSKGDTPTDKLVFGFCEITTDGYVGLHYHEEAEIYYILKGEGIVSIDGKETAVKSNDSIFLPSNSKHSIHNKKEAPLEFVYILNTDSFADAEYIFKF